MYAADSSEQWLTADPTPFSLALRKALTPSCNHNVVNETGILRYRVNSAPASSSEVVVPVYYSLILRLAVSRIKFGRFAADPG